MTPQWAFRNVCHEVGRCGTGGTPAAFRIAANCRAAHAMADVLQRALNARVAPRRVLVGHPHHQCRISTRTSRRLGAAARMSISAR